MAGSGLSLAGMEPSLAGWGVGLAQSGRESSSFCAELTFRFVGLGFVSVGLGLGPRLLASVCAGLIWRRCRIKSH